MIIIQLLIVLLALYVGSRYGSIALGVISGIGLAVLVFAFGLKPGTPPTDVILLQQLPVLVYYRLLVVWIL